MKLIKLTVTGACVLTFLGICYFAGLGFYLGLLDLIHDYGWRQILDFAIAFLLMSPAVGIAAMAWMPEDEDHD